MINRDPVIFGCSDFGFVTLFPVILVVSATKPWNTEGAGGVGEAARAGGIEEVGTEGVIEAAELEEAGVTRGAKGGASKEVKAPANNDNNLLNSIISL